MNKKNELLSILAILAFGVLASTALRADPITVTYTGDNVVEVFAQCATDDCEDPEGVAYDLTGQTGLGDWQTLSVYTGDFDNSTYTWIGFIVSNIDGPAGFLAQILYGGETYLTGAEWEVTTCTSFDGDSPVCDWSSWTAASLYGADGDPGNIWTYVTDGFSTVPSDGFDSIDDSAQWIWTANNGCTEATGDMGYLNTSAVCHQYPVDTVVALRVHLHQVPEPASIALLGLGLLGMGVGARRRKSV